MKKNNLTIFEILYIKYCKTVTGFWIDPICAAVVIYMFDNPLDSLFLSGFVYVCVYSLIRIPMIVYYNDV